MSEQVLELSFVLCAATDACFKYVIADNQSLLGLFILSAFRGPSTLVV